MLILFGISIYFFFRQILCKIGHLKINKGTIHGIIGENGAGKSTLMSIVFGLYQSNSGSIKINGKEINLRSPRDSIVNGIGMVHQHFMLVENFT